MSMRTRSIFLATLALAASACAGGAPKEAQPAEVQGPCADVYGGSVCTFAQTRGTDVEQVGAVIPIASIENAPAQEAMAWPPVPVAVIDLPPVVREKTGITQLTMYWEAGGHPPGPYLTPHFDFHFYTVDSTARSAIDCSDNGRPSALPAGYALPDVPLPAEMAKMMGVDTLRGLCVPRMGMHALPASELAGTAPFRGDMVIGYYHASPIFVEPMLTRAMLMERKSFDLPVPSVPAMTGTRPTTFHAEYDAAKQAYRFEFSGFTAAN